MSKSSSSSTEGIGCLGVILIIFITLKLLGVAPVATWSWLWVLSPWLIPVCLAGAVFIIGGLTTGMVMFIEFLINKFPKK